MEVVIKKQIPARKRDHFQFQIVTQQPKERKHQILKPQILRTIQIGTSTPTFLKGTQDQWTWYLIQKSWRAHQPETMGYSGWKRAARKKLAERRKMRTCLFPRDLISMRKEERQWKAEGRVGGQRQPCRFYHFPFLKELLRNWEVSLNSRWISSSTSSYSSSYVCWCRQPL